MYDPQVYHPYLELRQLYGRIEQRQEFRRNFCRCVPETHQPHLRTGQRMQRIRRRESPRHEQPLYTAHIAFIGGFCLAEFSLGQGLDKGEAYKVYETVLFKGMGIS